MIIAIVITGKNSYTIIQDQEITHLQASDNYTILFCMNKEQFVLSKCLSATLKELDDKIFVRIHHSFAVNIGAVHSLDKGRGGYVYLKNEVKVPVSYLMKKNLKSALQITPNAITQ